MKITFTPSSLNGTIDAPPSKSMTHRYLIGAALSKKNCTLSGIDYINFICDVYGVKEERKELIDKYATMFNIKDQLVNQIKSYSHGMKQKVVLIAALAHNPKLLILDEPFVGLDPKASYDLKEVMKELCANGTMIFFSSHVLEVVEKLCNKIAIIKKGHILAQRSVKELEEQGIQLESYYMNMIENTKADATPVSAVEAEAVEA